MNEDSSGQLPDKSTKYFQKQAGLESRTLYDKFQTDAENYKVEAKNQTRNKLKKLRNDLKQYDREIEQIFEFINKEKKIDKNLDLLEKRT